MTASYPLGKTNFWWLLILVQAMILAWVYQNTGVFEVATTSDAWNYTRFNQETWLEALGKQVTIVYPVFYYLISELLSLSDYLGWVQYLIHVVAVMVLWQGLKIHGLSPRLAFFVASPLLYANIVATMGRYIQTDAAGASLAVMTVGLLFATTGRPLNLGITLSLSLSLFLTYMVRPMYLFMIPLVPLLGLLLHFLGRSRGIPWYRTLQRLILVALVPYLLFSSVRLVTVHHFGIVSYGGSEVMGILASMVDKEIVDKLDPETRPLAQAILEKRQHMGLVSPFSSQGIDRFAVTFQYQINEKEICRPLAFQLYGDSQVLANRHLSRLARIILQERLFLYLKYVAVAFVDGMLLTIRHDLPSQVLLWALLPVLLWRRVRIAQGRLNGLGHTPQGEEFFQGMTFFLVAIMYFCSGTLLVVLVEPPLERYMFGTAVFLPGFFGFLLHYYGSQVFIDNPVCVQCVHPSEAK